MQIATKLRQRSPAYIWFVLAAVLCGLFLIYFAIFTTGAFTISSLNAELWLLQRPITRIDCTFYEWRNLGEVPTMVAIVAILGVIGIRAGFRKRVLPILLLLLLLCGGVELVGKRLVTNPLPTTLRSGMTVLTCPQNDGQPFSTHLAASLGLWWLVPPPPKVQVNWARDVAAMSLASPQMARMESENSFPGGHSMRWMFVGLITAWLCWKRIKRRALRTILMELAILAAFGGGIFQFYIGVHFVTDTIAGYLFGAAAACCAIGFLTLNDLRATTAQEGERVGRGHLHDNPSLSTSERMHVVSGDLRG